MAPKETLCLGDWLRLGFCAAVNVNLICHWVTEWRPRIYHVLRVTRMKTGVPAKGRSSANLCLFHLDALGTREEF